MIIWGSKGRETIVAIGEFYCPGCNSRASYVHKRFERYFTLFFIPLFPIERLGEMVECLGCRQTWKPEVLTYAPPSRILGVVLAVRGELDSGVPVSIAETRLISAGFHGELAKRITELAAGYPKRICQECGLLYGGIVGLCSNCGNPLTPLDAESDTDAVERQEARAFLREAIARELAGGTNPDSVVAGLKRLGWSEGTPEQFVNRLMQAFREYRESADGRPVSAERPRRKVPPWVVWALAAVLGGALLVWGAIALLGDRGDSGRAVARMATAVPMFIRLEVDGSGDYRTLQDAIQYAAEGVTITLGPGTYELSEPLTIVRAVTLVGAGMDETEIVCDGPGYVIRFLGDGPFAARDITFRHEGQLGADVVVVPGGWVEFLRCRFSGGVEAEEGEAEGAGLLLHGATMGMVQDCKIEGNGSVGILLYEHARPTLERNECVGNRLAGIGYMGNTGGIARQNRCVLNAMGISVMGSARPTLTGNICSDNTGIGILYSGNAAGIAQANDCSRNETGIIVAEQANPTLEGNTCTYNQLCGIFFTDNAGGVARQNVCVGNGFGIGVDKTAQPSLENNDCHGNTWMDVDDTRD